VQAAELGNHLVIRGQTVQQPHYFDIAVTLGLQPTRRAYLLQIPVQIQLEQITWVIAGTTCRRCNTANEPQSRHVQTIDKGIYHTTGMIPRNHVIQTFGKHCPLSSSFSHDVAHKQ
jgi:hypothetical protein